MAHTFFFSNTPDPIYTVGIAHVSFVVITVISSQRQLLLRYIWGRRVSYRL